MFSHKSEPATGRYRTSWIERIPEAIKQQLRDAMTYIDLAVGECLYHQGDEASGIYEIVEGRLKLSVYGVSGKEVIVGICRAPTTIGETSVIAASKHIHTAEAVEKTRVGLLKLSEFNRLRKEYPEINELLLKSSYIRLMMFSKFFEESSTLQLKARLASRLHLMVVTSAEALADGVFSVDLRQDDLAGMANSTRQSVNKVLKDWEQAGIVEVTYGKILIKQPELLLEMAEGDLDYPDSIAR